jgi:hypothetical protein
VNKTRNAPIGLDSARRPLEIKQCLEVIVAEIVRRRIGEQPDTCPVEHTPACGAEQSLPLPYRPGAVRDAKAAGGDGFYE